MGLSHVAGYRDNLKGQQELQEGIIESDQRPLTFYDRGGHVIMNQLLWGSFKVAKGIKKATVQCFLPL